MKSLYRILAAICIAATATSCQGTHSCTCTYTANGVPTTVDGGDIKGSKNHAFHECCVIRAAQIGAQVHADVTCAVPI